MDILGVPIDNLSRGEVVERVRKFLDEPKFHRIATVNPEFLLLAEKDASFRRSLLDADLRIADGFGIVLAGLLSSERITRFPGVDLMEEILKIANEKRLSVYLAVRQGGLSSFDEVKSAILKKYPGLKIDGGEFDVRIMNQESGIMNLPILNSQFSILLCNFGIPHQELFLSALKDSSVAPRLVMGVGGAFDFLTGKMRRAPKCLRVIGLEWLWRLLRQPKRWKRIWNATIVFSMKVLFSRN